MPYKTDIQALENYVRVHVSGVRRSGDTAFQAGQAGQQIAGFCRKVDIFNVLVVLDLTGRLSAFDSYEMVNQSKEYGWDANFKLAFVDANQESVNDVRFTETVAVNRGYSVRHFTDEAEAVAWLLDGAR